MANLPSGTVTFLFTDIEGSTKLARAYPDRWEALCRRHLDILRGAIEANHGFVFNTVGDMVCAAFRKPGEALKAAIEAQMGLEREQWGESILRVRMGIHTGEAETDGADYQGYLALSLVQRIMSAGHGGQILVSSATENLFHGQLPENVKFRDLGKHKFKDIPHLARVFQVLAPELASEYPPLRTLDAHPNNLPAQLNSFIGREKELAEAKELLQNAHLLTLIGPGGTGKTRLSIQVASQILDQYPDGVWLVELAPVRDPELVPRTAAIAIGLRDEPQRPVTDMLCDYLREKKMLLLLDNCEHLVEACARLADRLLRTAPGTRILASTREALGIGGEVTYRVPSLGLADITHLPALESLNQYEAVRLFIDRAAAAIPAFAVTNENAPAVAQICYRLDGIPLAIELAAAKIRVLSVDQIATRLDDRFKLLTGGSRTVLERHQTLRAAVDWSYNLLPDAEQVLFRRLAVFVGGWTLEAAESVCGNGDVLDLTEQLINKSLVLKEDVQAGTRYRLLETIRQYANEKLVEAGEGDRMRDQHLAFFLDLSETAAPHLIQPDQLDWLAALDLDYENLRVAFDWALNQEAALPSLRICAALGWFWEIRGYWAEGLTWLSRALAKPARDASQEEKVARARALYTRAHCAFQHSHPFEQILASAQASLRLAIEASGRRDIAIARYYVGLATRMRGEVDDQARALMEQSLTEFQEIQDLFWQARSYPRLGFLLARQGKSRFQEVCLKSLELARAAGDRLTLADALTDHADWLVRNGQADQAREVVKESGQLYKELGSENTDVNSALLAEMAWMEGDTKNSKILFKELQERCRLLGVKSYETLCTANLGLLALDEGDLHRAQIYLEQALALAREAEWKFPIAFRLAELSYLFYLQGRLEKYKQYLRESLSYKNILAGQNKMYLLMVMLGSLYIHDAETTARLLGAMDRAERKEELLLRPVEKRSWGRIEGRARESLGAAAFEAAFAKGRATSLDEALEIALKTVEAM